MDSVILLHVTVSEEVAFRMSRTLIRAKGPRLTQIHGSMAAYDPAAAWR